MSSNKAFYSLPKQSVWFVLLVCSLFSLFLVCFDSSTFLNGANLSYLANISTVLSLNNTTFSIDHVNKNQGKLSDNVDECVGRYVYIQYLPSKFNNDLVEKCDVVNKWGSFCKYLTNSGLGPELDNSSSWFETTQFSLEIIFHNRMKQYRCLTNISSKASAVYVPFYAGLDIGRYLGGDHEAKVRDRASIEIVEYLKGKPEWKKMWGHDHFLVAGRISWDFRRGCDDISGWGSCLFDLPEAKNMTSLVIESSPWSNADFAIPYPTYFHPSTDDEIYRWQEKMTQNQRSYLFSFAGAPRPSQQDSIRNEVIKQCLASESKSCKFVKCDAKADNCGPKNLMRLFQESVFCLQPPGDSFTRRSTFDAILAGCIPVFFHPTSAYNQYLWHFPKNYSSYSVFISSDDVRKGDFIIEKRLLEIPKEKVVAMTEEVIKLIPKVIYANPNSRLERFEDAFDIAVKGVLSRIEELGTDGHNEGNISISQNFP